MKNYPPELSLIKDFRNYESRAVIHLARYLEEYINTSRPDHSLDVSLVIEDILAKLLVEFDYNLSSYLTNEEFYEAVKEKFDRCYQDDFLYKDEDIYDDEDFPDKDFSDEQADENDANYISIDNLEDKDEDIKEAFSQSGLNELYTFQEKNLVPDLKDRKNLASIFLTRFLKPVAEREFWKVASIPSSTVEDTISDTILALFPPLDNGKFDGFMNSRMCGTAKNKLKHLNIDAYRKQKRRGKMVRIDQEDGDDENSQYDDIIDPGPLLDQILIDKECSDEFNRIMSSLDLPIYPEVAFRLMVIGGYKREEIAIMLEPDVETGELMAPVETVSHWVSRVRIKLWNFLNGKCKNGK